MNKKNLALSIISFFVVTAGFFLFSKNNKTIYIKNSEPHLAIANIKQFYQAEDKIGDLSNTIIPKIIVPDNLTENFANLLAKEIIGKNNQPKNSDSSSQQRLNVPDPNKITEEFIKGGLKTANENILNIKSPDIKISPDNSKENIILYLTDTQKIIKDNLKGEPILSVLEGINKNNGQGLEKLLPIISAHEITANQIEEHQVPRDLNDLMAEEVRLLRMTANVLRVITKIEEDPLGAITATKQFEIVVQEWGNLQLKFNNFTQKLNRL